MSIKHWENIPAPLPGLPGLPGPSNRTALKQPQSERIPRLRRRPLRDARRPVLGGTGGWAPWVTLMHLNASDQVSLAYHHLTLGALYNYSNYYIYIHIYIYIYIYIYLSLSPSPSPGVQHLAEGEPRTAVFLSHLLSPQLPPVAQKYVQMPSRAEENPWISKSSLRGHCPMATGSPASGLLWLQPCLCQGFSELAPIQPR